MNCVKIKDNNHLIRDTENMAILNNNSHEFQTYVEKRKKAKQMNDDINSLKEEIHSIKSDMSEIKKLLIGLSNANN